MEEKRQIEKIEIVERDSVSEFASASLQLAVGELRDGYPVGYDKYQARLMKLTPFELAFRRTIGQVVDFSIAYGGVFVYFFQSGFLLYHGAQDLIHPLSVNLSLLGVWHFILLFALSPVPYLYLYWYFKVLCGAYTPGEKITGIGRTRLVFERGNSGRFLLFAFWQFCQVIFALVWGVIAMTPLCLIVGLFLMLISLFIGGRRIDELKLGLYLAISGLVWMPLFALEASKDFRSHLVFFVAIVAFLIMVFLVLSLANWPVPGNKLQSRSDVRYGMLSVALRKLGKSR